MKNKNNETINDLVNFNNIKIYQNKNYFNFSLDSILLPNFVILNNKAKKVLDFCTGIILITLILSKKIIL